jgi:hypothetical protein
MSLESTICDILANYWLEENLYCGMASTMVYDRLTDDLKKAVSLERTQHTLREMEKNALVSTRGVYDDLWVYPKRKLLEKYDNLKVEKIGIYTKQLRLGGSQVEHRFFKRDVLERYRKDPRYRYEEWGVAGTILIRDKFFLDDAVPESDKVDVQYFGTGYTEDDQRVIAVILKYLGTLSIEHQNYWSSFEIKEKCYLDSDYVSAYFEAKPTDRLSPFPALLTEINEINKICKIIGEPLLFRQSYVDSPPSEFNWLSRPTRSEYNSFVHVLDKIISENINRDFFKGKIELVERIPLSKNKVLRVDKNTIRLLAEYFEKYWQFPDPKPKNEMIETFKIIRKARQDPAHKIMDNHYNPAYFERQRRLIYETFKAVRILREILMSHPKAKSYEPPRWLKNARL